MDTWTTLDGTVIKLTDMSDSHLKNTVKYLYRRIREDREVCGDIYDEEGDEGVFTFQILRRMKFEEMIKDLRNEQKRRGFHGNN